MILLPVIMLIDVCGIIALIHLLVKPYSSEIFNTLDGTVLHLIIFVTALPLINDFDLPLVVTMAFVLVIFPLINFIAITIFIHKNNFRKIFTHIGFKAELPINNETENNETDMRDFGVVVDDSMRKNATICDV